MAPPRGGSAYTALAAEIAYDRALIALCTERGIDAHATSFAYPRAERQRIETVLNTNGLDLDSPRKRRTGGLVSPWIGPDRSADKFRNGGTPAEDANAPPRPFEGHSKQGASGGLGRRSERGGCFRDIRRRVVTLGADVLDASRPPSNRQSAPDSESCAFRFVA